MAGSMYLKPGTEGADGRERQLKKLLAEAMLDNAMLKDLNSKNGDARRKATGVALRSVSGGRVKRLGLTGHRFDILVCGPTTPRPGSGCVS
jgi:hypothetical protein